jgi:hypothetical protein
VFFAAQNGIYGRELWRYDLTPKLVLFNETTELELNDELSFPLTDVGTNVSKELTLKNTGEIPLTFSAGAITIEGTGASSFSTGSFATTSLAVDGTVPLTITFEPDDEGLLSATLKINSSDPTNQTFTITLKGQGHAITGIDDPNIPEVTVYPNPSKGIVFIKCATPLSGISLLDATGKQVNCKIADHDSDEISVQIDSHPGLYVLQLKIHNQVVQKKVVILK